MISNQILQNTIDGLKAITRTDLCVIDVEGKILVATFPDAEQFVAPAQTFVESPADSQVVNGCQFFKVFDDHQLEYILLAYGDSEDVYMIGKIAAFQIQNLLVAYKERFDKDNFIKNLILDNLLLVDIYNRAKKLHIETEVRRVVFLVETNREKDGNELEKIRGLFGGKSKDFVTAVDEKNIIVVKELAENETYEDLNKTADVIIRLFKSDTNCNIHIAYGTIVNELKEVSRSYKEARMALDVGKIFFEGQDVIAYSQLGIRNHILSLKEDLSDIQCHARLFIRSRNLFQFVHNGTICDMNIAIGIRFKQPDDYICCLIQILIGFIFCKFFDYNNVFFIYRCDEIL